MKINAFEHSKKFIALFLTLIIAGVVMLCLFGINKGQELKGRIEIDVNIGGYNIIDEKDIEDFTNEVIKVITDNEGKVLQTNIQGENFDAVLVVSVEAKFDNRNENVDYANMLKNKIDQKYNDELLITSSRFESGIMNNPSLVTLTYVTLFAIIIALIYLIARVKLLNAMCVLATCFASIVTFLSLLVITRVQINANIICLTLICAIIGFVVPAIRFFDIKNNKKSVIKLEDCVIDFKSPMVIMLGIVIVSMIAMMIFGSPVVSSYALAIIMLSISVCLADNTVSMPLCYYLNHYTVEKNKKPVKAEKTVEVTPVETENVETVEESEEANEESTNENN